jgi:hypothetical protein
MPHGVLGGGGGGGEVAPGARESEEGGEGGFEMYDPLINVPGSGGLASCPSFEVGNQFPASNEGHSLKALVSGFEPRTLVEGDAGKTRSSWMRNLYK